MTKQVTLSLPMEQDFELVATETASALASLCGLSVDAVDEVRMAVIEACINAFEHSRADDRRVDVTIDPSPDELTITIEDHGLGFCCDPKKPAPSRREAGRKRGFGLSIMKAMMDEVSVETSEQGTRIILVKHRCRRPGRKSDE